MQFFSSITSWAMSAPLMAFCALIVSFTAASYYIMIITDSFRGILSALSRKIYESYHTSTLLHALGRGIIDRKCPKGLPPLDPAEKVSKNVWRILGMNPGSHTLQGTNTWLVGNGPSKVLIDTGEDVTSKKYVHFLLNTVFPLTETTDISVILLTHGHGDHLGGVNEILKQLKKLGKSPPKIYKRQIENGNFPSGDYPCEHIRDGDDFNEFGVFQEFEFVGLECPDGNSRRKSSLRLSAVYSPGHTDDHVAFVLQEDGFRALFSGDCVLGCGTTVFDNLSEYMESLQTLRNLMTEAVNLKPRRRNQIVTTIYPGHGPVIRGNALEKIDEYINHREKRENEILSVLEKKFFLNKFNDQNKSHSKKNKNDKNPSKNIISVFSLYRIESKKDEYLTSWEIMSKIYGNLPIFVKFSAQGNVLHHLEKLLKEEKVELRWPDLWKLKYV